MNDTQPCDMEYWTKRIVNKYIVGLLYYDLTSSFHSLPQGIKNNILGMHRHLNQCRGCNEELTLLLRDVATDESIAIKGGVPQVPPEAFRKFKNNREFLDNLI